MLPQLRSWFAALRDSSRFNREVDEELAFHLEARAEDLVRGGLARDEAHRQARLELGAHARHREEVREARGLGWLDAAWPDVLFAARGIGRNRAFSLVIVVILALGVGSNVAMFSIADPVLLRPLPFPSPDDLIDIQAAGGKRAWYSLDEFRHFEPLDDLFVVTAAYLRDQVTLTGAAEPEQVFAVRATDGLFAVLRVEAFLGQTPDQAGPRSVMISHRLWRRQFGGEPDALGRVVSLSGTAYTVVGVMSPEIEFPVPQADMWTQFDESAPGRKVVKIIARRHAGTDLAKVQAAMDVIAAQMREDEPRRTEEFRLDAEVWRPRAEDDYELSVLLAFAAFGCVLLIACGNVAGLLLGRAVQRQREIAIRLALGASRWRVARTLLAESLALATVGTTLGLLLAQQGLRILSAQLAALPIVIPHLQFVELNARSVGASAAICVVVAVVCSLASVAYATSAQAQTTLHGGARTGLVGSRPLFSVLIGTQAAFACFVLIGSGLMLHSVHALLDADKGFAPEGVVTISVPAGTMRGPRPAGKETPEQIVAYYQRLLREIERVNGPGSAALVSNLPLSRINMTLATNKENGEPYGYSATSVSSQYFGVMKTPLLAGRLFTEADEQSVEPIAIVNEQLARDLFPNGEAVGEYLPAKSEEKTRIVGVVGDAWQAKFDQQIRGEAYFPYSQFMIWTFGSTIVVRPPDGRIDAEAFRSAVWEVDPNQPIPRIQSMDGVVTDAIWRPRFSAWLFSLLGLMGLILSAIGTYSMVHYSSISRRREMGIRMSVGARAIDIVTLVTSEAMRPLLAGLLVGAAAAMGLAQVLTSVLYETQGWEPEAYLGAGAILLLVSFVASLTPAVRASTTPPATVLKTD